MKTPALGRTAPWMILALLFAGVGVWLAGRVAVSVPAGKVELGPPTKPTKVAERRQVDPVLRFDDACRKGMTFQQIGHILSDFQNGGLDGAGMIYFDQSETETRQKYWYLEALATGLSLDFNQREQAHQALFSLPSGGAESPPGSFSPGPLCPAWLRQEAAAPWRLCHLTDPQLSLTRFAAGKAETESGTPGNLRQPRSAPGMDAPPLFSAEQVPDSMLSAARFLPFSPAQKFPAAGVDDIGERIAALHPAQLEILFLLDGVPPGLVQRLDRDR